MQKIKKLYYPDGQLESKKEAIRELNNVVEMIMDYHLEQNLNLSKNYGNYT